MKVNWLTPSILAVGFALLLQAGCGRETVKPRELNPDWFQQQTWAVMRPAASEPAPRIMFEKVSHDFGEVGPGTNHLCEFKFTNVGDGVLTINEIQKTCGCTPFVLDKTEYAPGESGTLKVRYYVEPPLGSKTKYLYVQSNDRRRPKVSLSIKANVVNMIHCQPTALSLTLNRRNAGCPDIVLTSLDNQPFSVESFESTGGCITAAYDPTLKAKRIVLRPIVDMNKLESTTSGGIKIGLNHPDCKMVNIDLNVLPRYKVWPHSVIVRDAEPGMPVSKKIRILNNYREDFELESALSRQDIIKVLGHKKLNNGYELELQITPPRTGSTARVFSETLQVTLKDGRKLQIPCSGFYSRGTVRSRVSARGRGSVGSATSTPSLEGTENVSVQEGCEGEDCAKTFYFEPEKNKGS
jgi:hypothetical protein